MVVMVDGKLVDKEYAKKLEKRGSIWYCSMCNEYHNRNITKYTYNDTLHCCYMTTGSLYTCPMCNCRYTRNALKRDSDGNYCCSSCLVLKKYDEGCRVNNYYYKPEKRFYYAPKSYSSSGKDFKGVGIELEVDTAGESNINAYMSVKLLNNEVYVKHDGSLSNGFEIVTYPHTYEAFEQMNWKDTLRELILRGYRSHDSNHCGLHMHISRTFFTEQGIKNLMIFYDNFRDEIIRFARRDREQADRWAGFWSDSGDESLFVSDINANYDAFNKSSNHGARYKAVNIVNRDTIEIRIMRGTLNYDSFSACCEFMYKTALKANDIKDVWNCQEWLEGLSENCINYMKKRNCFGYSLKDNGNVTDDEDNNYEGDDLICV